MKQKEILNDKYYANISSLFERKGWDIEYSDGSVFDRFCKRLAYLKKDEEKDFILELTERYVWIRSDQYEDKLLNVLNKMFESDWWHTIDKKKNIILCPIKVNKDVSKAKSSTFMLYLCRSIEASNLINSKICNDLSLIKNLDSKEIGCLLFVDDYIGSGESFIELMNELYPSECEYLNKIAILSIAAQEQGIKNINREYKGFNYFCSEELLKKGLSDYYNSKEINIKKEMMKTINKQLNINKDQFGYEESEALISLVRTPNNTLPFFWCDGKRKDAPFARKTRDELKLKENGAI